MRVINKIVAVIVAAIFLLETGAFAAPESNINIEVRKSGVSINMINPPSEFEPAHLQPPSRSRGGSQQGSGAEGKSAGSSLTVRATTVLAPIFARMQSLSGWVRQIFMRMLGVADHVVPQTRTGRLLAAGAIAVAVLGGQKIVKRFFPNKVPDLISSSYASTGVGGRVVTKDLASVVEKGEKLSLDLVEEKAGVGRVGMEGVVVFGEDYTINEGLGVLTFTGIRKRCAVVAGPQFTEGVFSPVFGIGCESPFYFDGIGGDTHLRVGMFMGYNPVLDSRSMVSRKNQTGVNFSLTRSLGPIVLTAEEQLFLGGVVNAGVDNVLGTREALLDGSQLNDARATIAFADGREDRNRFFIGGGAEALTTIDGRPNGNAALPTDVRPIGVAGLTLDRFRANLTVSGPNVNGRNTGTDTSSVWSANFGVTYALGRDGEAGAGVGSDLMSGNQYPVVLAASTGHEYDLDTPANPEEVKRDIVEDILVRGDGTLLRANLEKITLSDGRDGGHVFDELVKAGLVTTESGNPNKGTMFSNYRQIKKWVGESYGTKTRRGKVRDNIDTRKILHVLALARGREGLSDLPVYFTQMRFDVGDKADPAPVRVMVAMQLGKQSPSVIDWEQRVQRGYRVFKRKSDGEILSFVLPVQEALEEVSRNERTLARLHYEQMFGRKPSPDVKDNSDFLAIFVSALLFEYESGPVSGLLQSRFPRNIEDGSVNMDDLINALPEMLQCADEVERAIQDIKRDGGAGYRNFKRKYGEVLVGNDGLRLNAPMVTRLLMELYVTYKYDERVNESYTNFKSYVKSGNWRSGLFRSTVASREEKKSDRAARRSLSKSTAKTHKLLSSPLGDYLGLSCVLGRLQRYTDDLEGRRDSGELTYTYVFVPEGAVSPEDFTRLGIPPEAVVVGLDPNLMVSRGTDHLLESAKRVVDGRNDYKKRVALSDYTRIQETTVSQGGIRYVVDSKPINDLGLVSYEYIDALIKTNPAHYYPMTEGGSKVLVFAFEGFDQEILSQRMRDLGLESGYTLITLDEIVVKAGSVELHLGLDVVREFAARGIDVNGFERYAALTFVGRLQNLPGRLYFRMNDGALTVYTDYNGTRLASSDVQAAYAEVFLKASQEAKKSAEYVEDTEDREEDGEPSEPTGNDVSVVAGDDVTYVSTTSPVAANTSIDPAAETGDVPLAAAVTVLDASGNPIGSTVVPATTVREPAGIPVTGLPGMDYVEEATVSRAGSDSIEYCFGNGVQVQFFVDQKLPEWILMEIPAIIQGQECEVADPSKRHYVYIQPQAGISHWSDDRTHHYIGVAVGSFTRDDLVRHLRGVLGLQEPNSPPIVEEGVVAKEIVVSDPSGTEVRYSNVFNAKGITVLENTPGRLVLVYDQNNTTFTYPSDDIDQQTFGAIIAASIEDFKQGRLPAEICFSTDKGITYPIIRQNDGSVEVIIPTGTSQGMNSNEHIAGVMKQISAGSSSTVHEASESERGGSGTNTHMGGNGSYDSAPQTPQGDLLPNAPKTMGTGVMESHNFVLPILYLLVKPASASVAAVKGLGMLSSFANLLPTLSALLAIVGVAWLLAGTVMVGMVMTGRTNEADDIGNLAKKLGVGREALEAKFDETFGETNPDNLRAKLIKLLMADGEIMQEELDIIVVNIEKAKQLVESVRGIMPEETSQEDEIAAIELVALFLSIQALERGEGQSKDAEYSRVKAEVDAALGVSDAGKVISGIDAGRVHAVIQAYFTSEKGKAEVADIITRYVLDENLPGLSASDKKILDKIMSAHNINKDTLRQRPRASAEGLPEAEPLDTGPGAIAAERSL